ncbi:unnamed protein product [Cuscuta epithymum]|uniref:RNase H type-1 domain-containing protein n=1 Tax=Cuscuta epithymum TaxID=186058 RepID=A0AAV0FEI4_9ASTE|nr:unnamed protein product [Cuscuta epithymum]
MSICNTEEETVLHMLCDCEFVATCWTKAAFGVPRMRDWFLNTLEWIWRHCQGKGRNSDRIPHASRFAYVIWCLWKARNAWIFEGFRPDADRVVRTAYAHAEEYNKVSVRDGIKQLKVANYIKWIPPDSESFKLNCDGSSWDDGREAGAGGVIRNHKGEWIIGFTLNIGRTDSFKAELWGLRQGLWLVKELNLKKVVVEVDSESMIKALKRRRGLWIANIGVLVRDC